MKLAFTLGTALCLGLAPALARAEEPSPTTPTEPGEERPDAPTPGTAAPSVTPPPAPPAEPPPAAQAPPPPTPLAAETPALKLTPLGYLEAHYSYNLNRPSNAITNYRGFDDRHNTFTISNAVAGLNADYGPVTLRILGQIGSTPSTYYLGEPTRAGTPGVNATGSELWKYLQEANVAFKAPIGRGLVIQLGLVPTPIGIEYFAVKDNWNYSRSNLFFGFPYYHTGVRATYEWTAGLTTTVAVFNGWNSVVDNNEEKSVQTNVAYEARHVSAQALYFGGVERPAGARSLEGPAWRHMFDVFATVRPTTWLSFAGQATHGWEATRLGIANWTAAAVYARVKPVNRVYIALRGDRFHESLARDASGRASTPVFWNGLGWVSSGTATLDVRPHDNLSVRLEVRHDVASGALFFRRDVRGDGSAASPFAPNARAQSTILLGATAWF